MILLDVDGVLTDGRIYLGNNGEEFRTFFVRDGLAIRLGQSAGLSFGIVSGRDSPLVERRARELDIEHVHQGDSTCRGCKPNRAATAAAAHRCPVIRQTRNRRRSTFMMWKARLVK